MDVADGPILDAGNALWMGLALIIVSWTGIRTALSGDGWSAWEIFKLIILLSIPRGMLQFYAVDFPGIGLSFPEIIVHQGSWLNGIIVDDTGSRVWEWLRDYLSSTWAHLQRAGNRFRIVVQRSCRCRQISSCSPFSPSLPC